MHREALLDDKGNGEQIDTGQPQAAQGTLSQGLRAPEPIMV